MDASRRLSDREKVRRLNDTNAALTIPTMAVSANAFMRVDKIGADAEPVPMIAGKAQAIAAGCVRRARRQRCDRNRGGCGRENDELTHNSTP